MNRKELLLRVIGFVGSVILTLAAYFIIIQPDYFHLEIKTALIIIFVLAVLQLLVQFVFFLNIWREKRTFWNLGIFVSFLSIVVIIIFFSIWIINHLNYNMMM